jgi:hypothetical protein
MPDSIKRAAVLAVFSIAVVARADSGVDEHQCCVTFDAGPSNCHYDDGTYGSSASDQHRQEIAEARQARCLAHEAEKAAKVQAADEKWCKKHHPSCDGCGSYSAGDKIYIDGSNGSDATACCGVSTTTACQTVSHAMGLVAAAATSGVVLEAYNSSDGGSWTNQETYPIHLGWGVTLDAPGIHFVSQGDAGDVFDVYAYDATDTGTVTIHGGNSNVAADGVFIGFDPALADPFASANATVGINANVNGQTGVPLVISEVWINANDTTSSCYDLEVGPGASVTFGPNPVELGNGLHIGGENDALTGAYGIYCKGAGASIKDDATATSPVLSVEAKNNSYLDVEDGCTVSLTQGPILGGRTSTPSDWNGSTSTCPCGTRCQFGCNSKPPVGVEMVGSGQLSFGSPAMPGSVLCADIGFDQETSNASGSPSVSVNGAVVDLLEVSFWWNGCSYGYGATYGSRCAGAMITAGTFSAANTTFERGYIGVFVGVDAGSVDLSGGGDGGNTFFCNSSYWGGPSYCGNNSNIVPANYAGTNLVNETASVGINAENASWLRWNSTTNSAQTWSCPDTTYTSCACTGPNCPSDLETPPDNADVIYLSTNTAAIPVDSSLGTQIWVVCDLQ